MRTDGVHRREFAETGPVTLKVVPVTGAAFTGHHGPNIVRLSFATPTLGMKWVYIYMLKVCDGLRFDFSLKNK